VSDRVFVGLVASTLSGRLPPIVIQSIVRKNFGQLRVCYERALATNAELTGRVNVRFVIERDGKVSHVTDGGSDMPVPARQESDSAKRYRSMLAS
jgi:hypothetical protein